MKKMRKLIPAFAMLMVAAIMMSTASFAWFSMNTTAAAGGMEVQAKAGAGILISNGNGTWASSANAQNASDELMPTSTKNGSAWYATTSTDASQPQVNQATGTYLDVTGEDGYYLANTFYIKASSTDAIAKSIVVSNVKITETQDLDMNEALRVLIVYNSTAYIYSLSNNTYKVLKSQGPNTFEDVSSKSAAANDDLGVTSIPGVAADSAGAVAVQVYVYFEGEDPRCFTNNIKDAIDTLSVDITFALAS